MNTGPEIRIAYAPDGWRVYRSDLPAPVSTHRIRGQSINAARLLAMLSGGRFLEPGPSEPNGGRAA